MQEKSFKEQELKEVLRRAKTYTRYIMSIPAIIEELRRQIKDNDLLRKLPSIPAQVYEYGRGSRRPYSSPTSLRVEEVERLEDETINKAAKIEALYREWEKFRHFLTWLSWHGGYQILENRYKGMGTKELCRKLKWSEATIRTKEREELLTMASVILNIRAIGEFYDDNSGQYFYYTDKQKARHLEWLQRLKIPLDKFSEYGFVDNLY